jgi:hypothetical protein
MVMKTQKPEANFFLMRQPDISTTQTGDFTMPGSESPEEDDKPEFEVLHALTPDSSVYSAEASQTSSALGRLMEYVDV